MMQLAYSTWGMPTVPPEVAIPHLAKLGFEAVELTVIPHNSAGFRYTTDLAGLDAAAAHRIQ